MNATGDSQTAEVEGMADEGIQREVLPIPDRRQVGLTTDDAKDPIPASRQLSRCGSRRGHPMCWWC
jgi:hypothetical protein